MNNWQKECLIIIMLVGLTVRLAMAWQPVERMAAFPMVDDSFYSLGIARNIALGKGLTADGIHQTNGFQPLYVFLSAPVYLIAGGSQYFPLHIIMTLISLLGVGTIWLIFKIMSRVATQGAALFSSFLWSISPTVIEFEMNGLETGLYIFLLALTIYYYLEYVRNNPEREIKHCLTLGLLLGLCVLARIDAGFFVLTLTGDFIWANRKLFTGDRVLKFARNLMLMLLVGGVVITPWFSYNFLSYGNIIPVSGQAVRLLSLYPIFSGEKNLSVVHGHEIPKSYYLDNAKQSLAKLFYTPLTQTIFWLGMFWQSENLGYALLLACFALIVLMLWYAWPEAKQYFSQINLKQLNFTLWFAASLLAAYIFYVFGRHYYVRYYFPIVFITVLYSGAIYDLLTDRLLPSRWSFSPAWVHFFVVLIFIITISYQLGERYFDQQYPTNSYYPMAKWVNDNIEPGARVGVFSSGTISYFAVDEVTIINLDGVVNLDAFKALQTGKMLDYVRSNNINYVFDVTSQINEMVLGQVSDGRAQSPYLKFVRESVNGFDLYRVVPKN